MITLKPPLLVTQGYSSKERKGALFNEWEFSEAGVTEQSEVLLFDLFYTSHVVSHATFFLSFFWFSFYKAMDQKHVPSDQDQSSMLKVICSQRDRFRARLRETEEVTGVHLEDSLSSVSSISWLNSLNILVVS